MTVGGAGRARVISDSSGGETRRSDDLHRQKPGDSGFRLVSERVSRHNPPTPEFVERLREAKRGRFVGGVSVIPSIERAR
jgi:hypothetical protein